MRKVLLPLGLSMLSCNLAYAQPLELPTFTQTLPVSVSNTFPVESVDSISFLRALELASSASPELAAARRELAASRALISQAGARPNPILSASQDGIRGDAPETTLELSQEIELGGKRSARIEAAQRAMDVAAADLQDAQARLRGAVMGAYYDVLTAQERLDLAQAASKLAKQAVNVANRRVRAGMVSPVEETRARVAATGVQVELAQATAELEAARTRLAANWGNPQPRFERVKEPVEAVPPLPELAELYSRLNDSAQLTRARREAERRRAALELERTNRFSNVTVSVGAQRSDEYNGTLGLVSISMPLPLFDRNQGNIGAAQERAYQAQDELNAVHIRLKSELSQAHMRLRTARQQFELLRNDMLPSAQSAYEAASKGFELGKFTFLDVLDAQRTLFQARSQYLSALSQANQAAAEIARIVGDGSAVITSATQP